VFFVVGEDRSVGLREAISLIQSSHPWLIVKDLSIVLSIVMFVSLAITWIILYFVRMMDIPNHRSAHKLATPKCGGVGIVCSVVVGVLLTGNLLLDGLQNVGGGALLVALLLVAGVSLVDDVIELSPWFRLMVQLLAGMIVLCKSIVPLAGGGGAILLILCPLAILWIVGMANLFNFMDGIDGLAAGEGAIVAIVFGIIQFLEGHQGPALLGLILAVSCIGFLAFNFPPAKVFMGDVGSVSIGFLLAVMALLGFVIKPCWNSFWLMPLLSANFIFDGLTTLLRRVRDGENLFEAHRTHLYQRFSLSGFSQRTVTMSNYGMAICQGVIVLQTWDNLWVGLIMICSLQFAYRCMVIKLEERWQESNH